MKYRVWSNIDPVDSEAPPCGTLCDQVHSPQRQSLEAQKASQAWSAWWWQLTSSPFKCSCVGFPGEKTISIANPVSSYRRKLQGNGTGNRRFRIIPYLNPGTFYQFHCYFEGLWVCLMSFQGLRGVVAPTIEKWTSHSNCLDPSNTWKNWQYIYIYIIHVILGRLPSLMGSWRVKVYWVKGHLTRNHGSCGFSFQPFLGCRGSLQSEWSLEGKCLCMLYVLSTCLAAPGKCQRLFHEAKCDPRRVYWLQNITSVRNYLVK